MGTVPIVQCTVEGCRWQTMLDGEGGYKARTGLHVFTEHREVYYKFVCGVLAPKHGELCDGNHAEGQTVRSLIH